MWLVLRWGLGGLVVGLPCYIFWPPADLDQLKGGRQPYSTVVLGSDGTILSALVATDGQWRFPAQDSLPHKYRLALLIAEDRYFDRHFGFNPVSIGRAVWANLKAGRVRQGGSTITQQAIRISRQNPPRTILQKLSELVEAIRWEVWMTKDEILTHYAANAPMGGNVVGLSTACWRYFGTLPQQLSWAQAATLAVLPNAPGWVHLGRGRGRLLQKRNRLLGQLRDQGHIDQQTYQRALAEELIGRPVAFPHQSPHLLHQLARQGGGYGQWFRTTIDPMVQDLGAQLLQNIYPEKQAQQIHNIGLMVVRLEDQAVIAYHGNYPEQAESRSKAIGQRGGNLFVDMVQAKRSYGSLLKPILYATAITEGKITPTAWLEDVPKLYEGSYAPRNFNNQYQGVVSAHIALAHSLNIPFVNLQRTVGTARFLQGLRQLGIQSLSHGPNHYGLSLVLGGGEATLYELCQAYTLLANSQQARPAAVWGKTEGLRLSQIDSVKQWTVKTPLWTSATAQATTNALLLADRPDMDAAVRMLVQRQPVAWKTGTSWGLRDAWCIGYNEHYLVGIWLGNATGEGVAGLTGIRMAAPIMFRALDLLPNLPKSTTIPSTAGWHQVRLCQVTWHPAGPYCDSTIVRALPSSIKANGICPYHHQIFTDKAVRHQLNAQCAGAEPLVRHNWLVLPPALAWYYAPAHPGYLAPPPPRADCGQPATVQILYPSAGATIIAPSGEFIAKAYCSTKQGQLFWLQDGQPIGTTEGVHKMPIKVTPGQHTITVVGDQGASVSYVAR
jgi:penicillin-binding protein 1C